MATGIRRENGRSFHVCGLITGWLFLFSTGLAQVDSVSGAAVSDSRKILSEIRTEVVGERSTNQRVWQIVRQIETIHPTTQQAETEGVISQVVEVGNGLCYQDPNNLWQVSDPTWRQTTGGFIMDTAGYKLEIGKTAGSWLRYTVQDDTTSLRASVIMVSDGVLSVTFSTLNPAVEGQIRPTDPSRLVFPQAFGPDIDLEIQAIPGGYHQNIIFHQKPSFPGWLDPEKTKVVIQTEIQTGNEIPANSFLVSTDRNESVRLADLTQTVPTQGDIGIIREEMVDGQKQKKEVCRFAHSTVIENGNDPNSRRVDASKSFRRLELTGSNLLVEELDRKFFDDARYPVVWDYQIINQPLSSDTIWYARNTYWISASMTVDTGITLRIEPGTFVKINAGQSLSSGSGIIIAQGKPHMRIVFTNANDSNNGESIPTGTGPHSGVSIGNGSIFEFCTLINIPSASATGLTIHGISGASIQHNNFCYNHYSIYIVSSSLAATEILTIFNNLFVADPCNIDPCDIGIYISDPCNISSTNIHVYNNTFHRIGKGIQIAGPSSYTRNIFLKHNIFSTCQYGIYAYADFTNDKISKNGYFGNTNNMDPSNIDSSPLLATVYPFTSDGLNSYCLNSETNGGGLFQNCGAWSPSAAGYSVPNDWSIRGVAVSRRFTGTVPNITENTTWQPQYDSCDSGLWISLGYHHPRIDYYIGANVTIDSSTGVTLTIKPGTVIAHSASSSTGKLLIAGSGGNGIEDTIKSVGDPNPDHGGYITWVASGRAANTSSVGVPGSSAATFIELASGCHYDIRFTQFMGLGWTLYCKEGNGIFRDNQFFQNTRAISYEGATGYSCVNNLFVGHNNAVVHGTGSSGIIQNCTFDCCARGILGGSINVAASLTMYNCLFSTCSDYAVRLNDQTIILNEHHNLYYNNTSAIYLNYMPSGQQYPNLDSTDLADPAQANAQNFGSTVPYDFDPASTYWLLTDFADRLRLTQTSSIIDAGYDPAYEGMPFFTTDLGQAADMPPVDIGYHYPGVVRFVDAQTEASIQEQDGRSWTTAYKYLQDALDEAAGTAITSICVAAGTCYPDEDKNSGHVNNIRTETFNLVEGMELYGGFGGDEDIYALMLANRDLDNDKTILSGDIDKNGLLDANNSYHVVVGADHTVMDGFTITKGYANGTSNNNFVGGGLLNIDGNMIVSRCQFKNSTGIMGGGMANFGVEQVPLIRILNCAFQDNSAESGSYYTYGGAIYDEVVVPLIIDSQFENNQAFYGGAIADNQSLGMSIRCLFSENTAVLGGASYNGGITGGNHEIINGVFYGNSATVGGGAFYCQEYDGIDIINSIFWQNSSSGGKIAYLEGSTSFPAVMSINYSDIEDNTGCFAASGPYTLSVDNNIAADPLFASAANGDFHLKSVVGRWESSGWTTDSVHSPCIDTGDPAMDYSLEPVSNGEQINMGIFGNTPYASKSRRGSLTVTIAPTGAISAGARWKLIYESGGSYYYYNNGAEYESGDTISKLEPDDYWIEFTDINYEREYATPDVLPVSIGNLENKSITGTYAAVKWVSTSGSNSWPGTYQQPYRTIQYGIDNHGSNGSVIKVKGNSGQSIYYENITIDGSDGYFRLEGYEWPKINGGGVDSVMYLNQADYRVEISGFYITNGYAQEGAGVMIQSCSPFIENCRFYGNHVRPTIQGFDWARGGGLAIESGAPWIIGCDFVNNTAYGNGNSDISDSGAGGGVFTHDCLAIFRDCSIGVQVNWYPSYPNDAESWYESPFWIQTDEIFRVGPYFPDIDGTNTIRNGLSYWGTRLDY